MIPPYRHRRRREHIAPIGKASACARIDRVINSLNPKSPPQLIGNYMACPRMNSAMTLGERVAASIIRSR